MKYAALIFSVLFSAPCFGQGQMFLRATAAGGGPANLLLDDYPGAAAAYAVMKLDNDYAGSCLRVRRDSDNAEQDIGFSGNDIDEASINSFCSGANCFVRTWYDQSGNGNNATQTTTANQPKIYDSVTGVVYENSVAALSFDGVNDYVQSLGSFSVSTYVSSFTVLRPVISPSVEDGIIYQLNEGTSDYLYITMGFRGGGYFSRLYRAANPFKFITANGFDTGLIEQNLISNLLDYGNDTNSFYYNNTLKTDLNPGRASSNQLYSYISIGAGDNAAEPVNIKGQLFIFYESDQSANRTGIETIINNYFSIY